VQRRLADVNGVASVTTAVTPPLGGVPRHVLFTMNGGSPQALEEARSAEWYAIGPDYFETLRVPVARGRGIGFEDRYDTRPVAVINAAMARRFWPDEDPIGRLVQTDVLEDQPREIVGIVGDVRQDRFQVGPAAQIYVPRVQLPRRMDMTLALDVLVMTYVIRPTPDAPDLIARVRGAIREVDSTLAISSVGTVEEYAARQLLELNQYATLLAIFGAISGLLAVVGIFGVMAQAVNQRRGEIGLRVALGAQRSNVLSLVLGQGVILIAGGLALGLITSLMLTSVIRSALWGVTATDPATFTVVAAGLGLVALLACYLPARRALAIQPSLALRTE